ncbi:LOW QUALITY PROTEIN: hypothetical protein HID58_075590 [Brassica napus]|uniref:Bet v I/Major latex protein domain-containing protein n=1 Tax=Brassica napus TaxID=3708 RepID=A0ABQ7YKC9_BRANA|nr:LOW QUALITY PROTEIN: hypothetical protein HID58_075590 [Brassica napus]
MVQATMQSYMVGEMETTIEIKAPAQKYYHMLTGKPKDLPPDNLQKCDVLEGEPGKVGRIISWNYNLMVARVIGGDLMKEFKNFFLTIQATPKQRGPGSVVKCHLKYERIDKKVADPEDILVFGYVRSVGYVSVEALLLKFCLSLSLQLLVTIANLFSFNYRCYTLRIGDQVPVDGVLISGHSLAIDESSMIGEIKIVHKDQKSPFLMSGCKVADGVRNVMCSS